MAASGQHLWKPLQNRYRRRCRTSIVEIDRVVAAERLSLTSLGSASKLPAKILSSPRCSRSRDA